MSHAVNEDDEFATRILPAWDIRGHELSGSLYTAHKCATAQELARIAEMLELEAVDELVCDYTLKKTGKDRFELTADFHAHVRQMCNTSLDVVPHRLEGHFSLMLWPARDVEKYYLKNGQFQENELELATLLADEGSGVSHDPEPYENDILPIGRLVYEYLVMEVDPYFSKEGAALEPLPSPERVEPEERENPFAVLKSLKKSPQD